MKYVLIVSATFVFWNVSHPKKNWARYDLKMYVGINVKYPLFLSDFNGAWIFFADFRKMLKN